MSGYRLRVRQRGAGSSLTDTALSMKARNHLSRCGQIFPLWLRGRRPDQQDAFPSKRRYRRRRTCRIRGGVNHLRVGESAGGKCLAKRHLSVTASARACSVFHAKTRANAFVISILLTSIVASGIL